MEAGRGRAAGGPCAMPPPGWKDVLFRVYRSLEQDQVMLTAAGSTLYLLRALFPALTAFASLYGFWQTAARLQATYQFSLGFYPTTRILPRAFGGLVEREQCVKAIFEASNVAYGLTERNPQLLEIESDCVRFYIRQHIVWNYLSFAFSVISRVSAGILRLEWSLVTIIRWPLIAVVVVIAISAIYRFVPDREHANWRWPI